MTASASDGRSVFNAADDLISHNLAAGRGDKPAYIDDDASMTFAELDERVRRAQSYFLDLGLRRVNVCCC